MQDVLTFILVMVTIIVFTLVGLVWRGHVIRSRPSTEDMVRTITGEDNALLNDKYVKVRLSKEAIEALDVLKGQSD